LGFFGFSWFHVFEVDLLVGNLEDGVFGIRHGGERDFGAFATFGDFVLAEGVGDSGAEGRQIENLAEDDFEGFRLRVLDVGEDDDRFDVGDAAVLDFAFFDLGDLVDSLATLFDGEVIADLGEGGEFLSGGGRALDLEVGVADVRDELQAEFILEDFLSL
jgi:hypothetical protein